MLKTNCLKIMHILLCFFCSSGLDETGFMVWDFVFRHFLVKSDG